VDSDKELQIDARLTSPASRQTAQPAVVLFALFSRPLHFIERAKAKAVMKFYARFCRLSPENEKSARIYVPPDALFVDNDKLCRL